MADYTTQVLGALDDLGKASEKRANEIREEIKEIKSEVDEIKKKNGALKFNNGFSEPTFSDVIMKGLADNHSQIKGISKSNSFNYEVKAVANMTAANNLTGDTVRSYSNKVADAPPSLLHFRQLAGVVPSSTGTYIFPRYSGGEGAFASQSTHGDLKANIDYDFTMVTVTCDYLAGFARVAKQMLQDLPFLQGYLPTRLQEDYLQAEDSAFYTALAAAATGSTTITGTPTVDAEQILGWVANLKAANYRPTGIVVNPKDWYKILVTKPSSYSVPGGFAITPDGQIRIAGLPVFESTFIPEDKVLVGDWNQVQVVQADGIRVELFEQDSDNVQRNLITARAEARVGLAILRPDAFVLGDLGNIA